MARVTKSGRHQLNLYEELHEFLDQVADDVWESKEKALDEAADYFVQQVKLATPVSSTSSTAGKLRESWERTEQYKNARYVYNTDTTQAGIPVANLVEFSKNGKPFIRPCFEKNKEKIVNIIIGGLKK